jgi:uncharacterized protein YecT (DUF1311 family)
MRNAIYPVVLAAGLAVAGVASAEECGGGLSVAYSACMDASNGVTINMVECAVTETKLQDARLNAAYKKAIRTLTGQRGEALKLVQREWIRYRDLNCGFEASGEGTIARINGSSCMLTMTQQRAGELETIAETN